MNVNEAAAIFASIRGQRPLIHQITNFVVMNTTANITLCAGALPVMAHAVEEVEEMAGAAAALVLNIGTLWPEQVRAMRLAANCANRRGIPVVLDPVGAGATRLRTEAALSLLRDTKIDIVRGNAAEVAALAGMAAQISGVESIGTAADTVQIAVACARKYGCVAVVTGVVDVVTDGNRLMRVSNGHALMAAVTGTGCMSTAVVASCAAIEKDRVKAAGAALAAYGLAGEIAATRAKGPGSFQVELFDSLAALDEETMRRGMRIEESTL